MKQVSPQKFDALIAKNIHVSQCKCGAGGGNIVVQMPWYGIVGARVICPICGRHTRPHAIHTAITDSDNRIGTPTIEKSLMNGIHHAVDDWNNGRLEYNALNRRMDGDKNDH